MDIRKKTLDIVLDLVSPKNIDEVILVLKKELNKTSDLAADKARHMLTSWSNCSRLLNTVKWLCRQFTNALFGSRM